MTTHLNNNILIGLEPNASTAAPKPTKLGIVAYALGIHQRQGWAGRHQGLPPALAFLEECHRLGAGGIQFPLSSLSDEHTRTLRQKAEQYEMFIEGIINPPSNPSDLDRFERDVKASQQAGATLARTVIMPGRRYEQFKSAAEFRQAAARGLQSLQWTAPILAKHRFRLAVENHKDERVEERLATLRRVGSPEIGICVDVGNNLALLDDPMETVRAFAPLAMTVHIKDHQVQEYSEGFLLADAALGEGFLDLPAMVDLLRQAQPNLRFNLETITRDPLRIPIFTKSYWATLTQVPAHDLARIMELVKRHSTPSPLPGITGLSPAQQLDLEQRHVQQSLAYTLGKL